MDAEKTSEKRDGTTVEKWGSTSVRAFSSPSLTERAREAILNRESPDENPILFSNKYAAYLPGTEPRRMMMGVVEVDGVRYRLYSQ
ncbi:MAG: hypothetical protein HN976_31825 [Lentisphaerae bacterium]|jgi:hypothetical protein|nr:hypothetical protein [Lentisphaerota bacterium]MBT7059729.1 hypothetical protein [Lentisphaerota bacterium]